MLDAIGYVGARWSSCQNEAKLTTSADAIRRLNSGQTLIMGNFCATVAIEPSTVNDEKPAALGRQQHRQTTLGVGGSLQ